MAERLPDVVMYRNAAWSMELDLFSDTARQSPFALTGYAAKAQLRAAESRTSEKYADLVCTIGSRDPVTEVFAADPDGNIVRISLPMATIAAITAKEGYADLLVGPVGSDPERAAYWKTVIGDGETVWP